MMDRLAVHGWGIPAAAVTLLATVALAIVAVVLSLTEDSEFRPIHDVRIEPQVTSISAGDVLPVTLSACLDEPLIVSISTYWSGPMGATVIGPSLSGIRVEEGCQAFGDIEIPTPRALEPGVWTLAGTFIVLSEDGNETAVQPVSVGPITVGEPLTEFTPGGA